MPVLFEAGPTRLFVAQTKEDILLANGNITSQRIRMLSNESRTSRRFRYIDLLSDHVADFWSIVVELVDGFVMLT